jgi:hypothetical protein
MSVQLVPINPYDATGMLMPFVVKRMIEMSQQHMTEMHPITWARGVAQLLVSQSPNVLMLAAVGDKGDVVGHMTCTIESDGIERWVFVSQCRVDPGEGSADAGLVKRGIEYVDRWARERGATQMVMATPRSDEAWRRRYGFKTLRHLMTRDIGSPVGATKED